MITIPVDLESVLNVAWERTRPTPGYLLENEARFLGLLAACTPAKGTIVEIGSFKGRSTVMLASVAMRYGLGSVVSIDPHNFNLTADNKADATQEGSTYDEFLKSLETAGVKEHVEIHHAFSKHVSTTWDRPIRLLWIDGDHSYQGVKDDFDGFAKFLSPGGVVAMHDSLNAFAGPIHIFAERVLRSSKFGPAGFVHSIAWSQYRPEDGQRFDAGRRELYRRAVKLLPYVEEGKPLEGWRKLQYKFYRSRVPRAVISAEAWATRLEA
ncbi:MAG TPA: class I SAM-dependent methyltransferase [Terriglobales bacterium]|nr:class I SAM-dependent methyltransferase [Terriglobales bacterium]